MNNDTLFATYTTQTEADTFVRIFNLNPNVGGRTSHAVRVGPGEYQVFILECPDFTAHFFQQRKAA